MRITRFLFLTTLLAVVVHSPISAQENQRSVFCFQQNPIVER